MVRRRSRRMCKLVLSVCGAVFCFGMLLRSVVVTVELHRMKEDSTVQHLEQSFTNRRRKSLERKSWYEPKNVSVPSGPGEYGFPFSLPPGLEKTKEELYKTNGFNALVSDFIALNRSLPDIRHPSCAMKTYLSRLPMVSIIIPFHNEHRTTLLRTVTSVLNRSPQELIQEIILVDDYSTKVELKADLDLYVNRHFPKVKILRAQKREGLIRARLLGAKSAIGDILLFLDSHTEANGNWLPPLIEPIAMDNRTVTCPFIDVIDFETLSYRAQDEGARGAFDWELHYKRLPLLPEDLKHPADPFQSPVMAGGLFAIDRTFFWSLGGYDEGLNVWGGEQYELSFKIWQCGGRMLDVPCSRVGHVYKKFAPFPNPGIGDFVGRNYKRVAEVWMDEFKEYVYLRNPHYRTLEIDSLEEQKALRRRLNCKPFKWFLENVAFDLLTKYPPIEPPDFARGEIRSAIGEMCIDTKFRQSNQKFGLDECIRNHPHRTGEQRFVLSWHKDIRPLTRKVCFDVSSSEPRSPITLWNCHGMQGNQLWHYDLNTHQLVHPITSNCLDSNTTLRELFMSSCDTNKDSQKWEFEFVNVTAILNG